MKQWQGAPPTKCQLCNNPLDQLFVDGKTQQGPWAILCPDCHSEHGVGIGVGSGQLYGKVIKKGKIIWECLAGSSAEIIPPEVQRSL